jgi:alkyldihydroxyacetonephosphate synthase
VRRWNGWGDDSETFEPPEGARKMLETLVGPGNPGRDLTLGEVVELVPDSRLSEHPLISTDPEERVRHARGQSLGDWIAIRYGQDLSFPDGVAHPGSDAEVRELIAHAGKVGAHLIPYGGGTSVVGHINPTVGDAPVLTVALDKLSKLRHLDSRSQLATFGAGVAGPELEAQLEPQGYTLGHFPQSFELSTLGGWVVTRSAGQQSMHYGRIEGLFSGGRMESPEGTLVIPSVPASAAGPDIREMVLGSEGRFGVLTEATVRVTPLPELEEFHAVFFQDWQRAVDATRQIVQGHIPLSMARVSTAIETSTSLTLAGHRWIVGALEKLLALRGAGDDKCMVILGVTGRKNLVRLALKEAGAIAAEHGAIHIGQTMGKGWKKNRFRSPYLRNVLWELGYAVDTLEMATTWTGINPMIEAVEGALRTGLADEDERVHVFSHLSHLYPTGANIYTTYLFRLADDPEETARRWQALKAAASQAIVDNGGTITHQHGIGVDHRPYLQAEKGELGLRAITALTSCFDPNRAMNPGKLVD